MHQARHIASVWHAQERLHRGEWAAVALAGLGTVGVGATSGTEPGGSGINGEQEQEQAMPSATRIVAVMLLLCAAVATLPLVLARRTAAADRRARSAKPSASVYGLQARLAPGLKDGIRDCADTTLKHRAVTRSTITPDVALFSCMLRMLLQCSTDEPAAAGYGQNWCPVTL